MNKELIDKIVKHSLLRAGFSDDEIAGNLEYVDVWAEWATESTVQALESIKDAGYAVVPVEPTREMVRAGKNLPSTLDFDQFVADAYIAMIKAAEGE